MEQQANEGGLDCKKNGHIFGGGGSRPFYGLDPIVVACIAESDHRPIILDMRGGVSKPASSFKFNAGWLKDQSFIDLDHSLWTPLDPNCQRHVVVQFMKNLKKLK